MSRLRRPRRRRPQREEAIEILRNVVEAKIGGQCPPAKPSWFKGHELDGYNEEKCIAFIYLTKHHTHHSNAEPELINFLYIKSIDALKELYCALNRVALIEVFAHQLERQELVLEKVSEALQLAESSDDVWEMVVQKCRKRCRTVMCRYRAMRRKYIEAKGRRQFPELDLNMIYEDVQTDERRGSSEDTGEVDGKAVPAVE